METKLTIREMELIKSELGFPSMLAVSSEGRHGGLALLWKSKVVVDTQTYSPHHIDAQVLGQPGHPWRLTGIYGYSEEQMKPETWRLLRHVYSQSTSPWVCIGDYNKIISSKEKYGKHPRPLPPMVEFRNTLLHYRLIDLGFNGYPYSWRNGWPSEALVEERLDRACETLGWSKLFPTAKVIHLTVSYSDHNPFLLDIAPSTLNHHHRHHLQRFEEKCVSHLECEAKIRESWTQAQTFGTPMHCLFEKNKRNADQIF